MTRAPRGYILVETVMAMALLSIGLIAIQGAIRQTIIVRGQARDYTAARFLLERTLSKVELQPQLLEGSDSGNFTGDYERFSWEWKVSKVSVPPPPMLSDAKPEELENFKLVAGYMTKIEATVRWKRGDRTFKETWQTLWGPEKLFVPKVEDGTTP